MKKSIALLFSLVSAFALFGCSKEAKSNTFVKLENNQTLFVGSVSTPFKNHSNEETRESHLTYTVKATYTLNRVYNNWGNDYSSNPKYILYEDRYYYWITSTVTDNKLLGNVTVFSDYSYSYLTYGDKENIAVKTMLTQKYVYDYKGGFLEIPLEQEYNLNGYFTSFAEIQEKCPELANLVPKKDTETYYADVTKPTYTSSTIDTYTSTYYYFS